MTEATTGARPLESSTTGEQQQQQQEEEVQNDGAAVEVPASSTRWHEHVSAWRREAGMLIRWPNQQALIALACVSPLRGACFMTVRSMHARSIDSCHWRPSVQGCSAGLLLLLLLLFIPTAAAA
jgi:hypothetical protein